MEYIKLKPCPFCGCTDIYLGHKDATSYHAQCKECYSSGTGFGLPSYSEEEGVNWEERCLILASESWNKRV